MEIIKVWLLFIVFTLSHVVIYTTYLQCEKDKNKGIYIKNFEGSGVLNENFGFCSNKDAVILFFKKCKVEQYLIRKDALEKYYPEVKIIVWECQGKCLIEDTNIVVNIIRCQKGILLYYIFSVLH